MNKDKSIFNLSIIELILVVFFMYIVITIYQISFKTSHIDELNKTVESQREITQEIVKKEYPKLEKRVTELVHLEKYKKLYQDMLNNNKGIFYIENQIIGNLNDANKLKDYNKYEQLVREKAILKEQILNLQGNKLTINTLNELNIKNEPLHRQIQFLEKKVKDNYQNKLTLANKLNELKTNESVKHILLKLNKYDAPVKEQIDAINNELKRFDKSLLTKSYNLEKNYNANTRYVLENLKYNGKPIENQIKILKQTLENQKLLKKIQMLENQLELNQKSGKYTIDTNNVQKALNNLQELKKDINAKYEQNTKDLIRKLEHENKPLENQINSLKKELELGKRVNELKNQIKDLQKQLDINKKLENKGIDNKNIQKALDNLQELKKDIDAKYNPNTKELLKELKQENKPLDEQINKIKKELELDKKDKELQDKIADLQKQLDINKELKNPNIDNENIQKALDNLQELKKDIDGKYNPNTKEILKELKQENKPLDNQINELKKQLDNPDINRDNIQKALDNLQELKKDIDKNLEPNTKEILKELKQENKPLGKQIRELKKQLDNPNINRDDIQKALDNLQELKKDIEGKYNPNTKEILKKLEQEKKPLDDQIRELKKQLDSPNTNKDDIQKALDNLQELKKDIEGKYNPNTKEILKELKQDSKPIEDQLNKLKEQLNLDKKGEDLENQIKDLKKQLDNNRDLKNPNLDGKDLQKTLDNLQDIKKGVNKKLEPNTKEILKELKQEDKPLDDQISELKKQLSQDTDSGDLKDKIRDLQKQIIDNNENRTPGLDSEKIQKALDNLEKLKEDMDAEYTPNTKEVLKELEQQNKPLDEQINELKKQLALDKEGKDLQKQLKDLKENIGDKEIKPSDIKDSKMQEALNDLQNIKKDVSKKYEPSTKEILKELKKSDSPLDEQIKELEKHVGIDKKGKDLENKINDLTKQIIDNNQDRNPNLDSENLQKALNNLQDIRDGKTSELTPNAKEILKELKQSDKPIDEQINELRKQLALDKKGKDLENQIKDLEKQQAQNDKKRDPNLKDRDIQKALDNLLDIKNAENTPAEKIYIYKLKDALDGVKEIGKIKDALSNDTDYKPKINKEIEQTIKFLEDKEKNPSLKPNENIKNILDKYNIKDNKPNPKQLGDLYLNLYSTPVDNNNISELNFVINRLKDQDKLENKIERINEYIKEINKPRNSFIEEYVNGPKGNDTSKEVTKLKNQVKYLQKKIEKSGKLHLPCMLDNEGSTLYLFKLFLREDYIYVQMGWQEGVAEMAKGLPNLDKLVEKTVSLEEFMKLTKPIFEESIKDECRQFVYFEDETISKKEYKRKTLTIEHHFYKYIEAKW